MLLPLKQGLKLQNFGKIFFIFYCCYATSIKTRIETVLDELEGIAPEGCYATSIKTRIETRNFLHMYIPFCVVMLLPLKQGLKLDDVKREYPDIKRLLCYFH